MPSNCWCHVIGVYPKAVNDVLGSNQINKRPLDVAASTLLLPSIGCILRGRVRRLAADPALFFFLFASLTLRWNALMRHFLISG